MSRCSEKTYKKRRKTVENTRKSEYNRSIKIFIHYLEEVHLWNTTKVTLEKKPT